MPRSLLLLVPMLLTALLPLAASLSPTLAQSGTPPASPIAMADLSGKAAQPLTGARRAAFEAFITDSLRRYGVVGAAVAVVQGGDVVYLQGFGVKQLGGTDPVTPDTVMATGSTTKTMSSMLAATVVDDGWLTWDTPVVDLLPALALADPSLTSRVTVADTFCNCTGLPTRTWQLIIPAGSLTPERIIASLAAIPVTAPYHEQFQYSNQMFIVGGYGAAIAAGGSPRYPAEGYRQAVRDRILGPIGMSRSTFTFDQVLANGNYAHPHAMALDGQAHPVPILLDAAFTGPAGPAGGLWSNARDMARYAQTVLAGGVAPDGTRVVSAENLSMMQRPGMAMPPEPGGSVYLTEALTHYGLGWELGSYQGQPLVGHSGGTLGFAAQMALLPEVDTGVIILTNGGQGAAGFLFDVQFRLFELLFDQPAAYQAVGTELFTGPADAMAALQAETGPVDLAVVAPFLGRYSNPAIGEISLVVRDDRLLVAAGGLRVELLARRDETGQVIGYVFASPPLVGPALMVTLQEGTDGEPEVVLTAYGEVSTPASPDETPQTAYVFMRAEDSAAATPSP